MRSLGETPPDGQDDFLAGLAEGLGIEEDETHREVFMSWEDVAAARNDESLRFESHSVNHPNLLDVTPEEARREMTESKEAIERRTGREVTSFCYPMGYYSDEIKAMVRSAGYRSATTVRFGLNKCGDDPMELKRIAVHTAPLCVFATELCGIYRFGAMMKRFDLLKSRLKEIRRNHAGTG
jgi:hypothetical protein